MCSYFFKNISLVPPPRTDQKRFGPITPVHENNGPITPVHGNNGP